MSNPSSGRYCTSASLGREYRVSALGRHIGHPGGLVTSVSSVEDGAAIGAPTGADGVFAGFSLREAWLDLGQRFRAAIEIEIAQRRLFLWLPVAAGAGVVLYFAADREPSLGYAGVLTAGASGPRLPAAPLASALRLRLGAGRPVGGLPFGVPAFLLFLPPPSSIEVRVLKLTGTIEEMDLRRVRRAFRAARREGAKACARSETPYRVRLTTRETPHVRGWRLHLGHGALLPPARLVLPGGYDFARDAYFARIGGVGSVLGRIETVPAPASAGPWLALTTAIDRARNALGAAHLHHRRR